MVKLISVPELIRNIFIGSVGLPKLVLLKGNFLYYFVLGLKYCIIGSEIRQVQDILKRPGAWSEKTAGEKAGFVLMSLIVLLNVAFAGILAVRLKKLVKQDDEKNQNEYEFESLATDDTTEEDNFEVSRRLGVEV